MTSAFTNLPRIPNASLSNEDLIPIVDGRTMVPYHTTVEQLGSALGGVIPKSSYLLSMLGDSISDDDLPTTSSGINGPRASGAGAVLEMLSAGTFHLHTARATAGFTIAQIASTHVSQIIADAPAIVVELSGSNDTYAAGTPVNPQISFEARRDTIWAPLLAAGIVVVACTLPLSASRTNTITSAQHAAAKRFNSLVRAAANYHPSLIIADVETATASSTGANEGTNIALYVATEVTYLHPNDTGALVRARTVAAALESLGLKPTGSKSGSPLKTDSFGTNPYGTGNNTSGTNLTSLAAGVTGTGPNGWQFTITGTSSAVVTPGAVARTDNKPGQLVQVAATIGADGNAVQIFPLPNSAILLSGGSGVNGSARASNATYVAGMTRRFSSGDWYKVIQPGTTAASEPGTLAANIGGFVIDGTVVWMRVNNLTAGAWIRTVAEFTFTAHGVGNIWPQAQMKQYASGYAALAAGAVFEMNNTTFVAGQAGSAWGTVQTPGNTGFNGYAVGVLPLNQLMRLETPWVQIAPDCVIIEPMFRLLGGAGATATVQVSYIETEIRA